MPTPQIESAQPSQTPAQVPGRKRTIAIAALAAATASSVGVAINRERLAETYHSAITFSPYKQPLLATLKDPDSAKFRKEQLNGNYLCGEFNAKNGYGAYGGFQRFIGSSKGLAAYEDSAGSPLDLSTLPLTLRLDIHNAELEAEVSAMKYHNELRAEGISIPRYKKPAGLDFDSAWKTLCAQEATP